MKKMIIENFKPFVGQHCETTATGSLLKQIGIDFSEPMLFGIGEGLGFLFWRMKIMDFPFIGGRVKTAQYDFGGLYFKSRQLAVAVGSPDSYRDTADTNHLTHSFHIEP